MLDQQNRKEIYRFVQCCFLLNLEDSVSPYVNMGPTFYAPEFGDFQKTQSVLIHKE